MKKKLAALGLVLIAMSTGCQYGAREDYTNYSNSINRVTRNRMPTRNHNGRTATNNTIKRALNTENRSINNTDVNYTARNRYKNANRNITNNFNSTTTNQSQLNEMIS